MRQMTAEKSTAGANGTAKTEEGDGDEAMDEEEASQVDARSVFIGNVRHTFEILADRGQLRAKQRIA